MALSSSNKSSLISESDYSDFEASMDGENNERVMSFLGESGPGCLNRQDEPKIERESLKRMKKFVPPRPPQSRKRRCDEWWVHYACK